MGNRNATPFSARLSGCHVRRMKIYSKIEKISMRQFLENAIDEYIDNHPFQKLKDTNIDGFKAFLYKQCIEDSNVGDEFLRL